MHYLHKSLGQNPNTGFTGLKSRFQQGYTSFWRFKRRNYFSAIVLRSLCSWEVSAKGTSQLLKTTYVICSWPPSFIFKPVSEVKVLIAQSYPTLCDPVDCSPPGSSVHGILQARILEWAAIRFSRGSSPPGDQTWVSCIAGRFFTFWATREALKASNSRSIPSHSCLLTYSCTSLPLVFILIGV